MIIYSSDKKSRFVIYLRKIMNKTISAIALSAVAMFGFAACAAEPTAAPTVTVTAEPPAPPAPVLTEEDLYIENLRSQNNFYIDSNTDADLVELGYILCSELDAGYTVLEVVEEIVYSGGFGGDQEAVEFAGLIIGAAVRDLCPEYTYQIEAIL
jgi:hypothetical protein